MAIPLISNVGFTEVSSSGVLNDKAGTAKSKQTKNKKKGIASSTKVRSRDCKTGSSPLQGSKPWSQRAQGKEELELNRDGPV